MKGFVYTLESIIASTLIITMILVVIPQATSDSEANLDPVRTGIESADQAGKLGSSPANISDSIRDFVPETFNYSTRVIQAQKKHLEITGDTQIELDQGYKKVLLWIEDADNLEATYRGETVLQTDGEGYKELELTNQEGYLNFTSDSVSLDTEINTYSAEGSILDGDTVYSISYINIENSTREIQVTLSR